MYFCGTCNPREKPPCCKSGKVQSHCGYYQ